jgi:Uma2 family endonuclease
VGPKRIIGAPDLVVEIASPGTATLDRISKYEVYARYGVPEYWIVKPTDRTIEVMILENGEYYSAGIFRAEQVLPSRIVPELPVCVEQFFL